MDTMQITPNKLDIIIFDVEHGNCAFVQSRIGETLLLDCGNKENFSPAEFIYKKGWANEAGIETVVISHHDSDHIADSDRRFGSHDSDQFLCYVLHGKYFSVQSVSGT